MGYKFNEVAVDSFPASREQVFEENSLKWRDHFKISYQEVEASSVQKVSVRTILSIVINRLIG